MVAADTLPYGLDYMETLPLEVPVVSQPVPDPSQPLPESGNGMEPGDDMKTEHGKRKKSPVSAVEQVSMQLATGQSKKPTIEYTDTASTKMVADAPIPVPFQSF